MPVQEDILSTAMAGKASSSAEGMAVGTGLVNGGTSKSNKGGEDKSARNADNKG